MEVVGVETECPPTTPGGPPPDTLARTRLRTRVGLLRWFDDTTRAPGFGDRALLAISLVVVVLAFTLQPSDAEVSLFGWSVPTTCTFRLLTGHGCPGCGLTRSFVYTAHGHLLDAFRMNVFGPVGFLVTAAQVPYRLHRLWRARA